MPDSYDKADVAYFDIQYRTDPMAYGGANKYTDDVAEIGRNPVRSTRFSLSVEMSRLTRDGTAEPVSRDQILRREQGQGNITFTCSADHEQGWQPYPVDPYSCYM